jgi:glucosamine--fructose-6-phosphate aminotransferase (isomerizing)
MKWLGKFPDPFLAEILGQPDALRRAAEGLAPQRDVLRALADHARGAGLVVFTGMGSSYDACYPAVNELARRGIVAGHVDAAELVHFRSAALASAGLLVVVSQSGESAEVVRLAESLADRTDRPRILSVTNGSDNPLARSADLRIDSRAGTETGPSTMTFAAALVVLAATGRVLAGDDPARAVDAVRASAESAAVAMERLLEDAADLSDRLECAVRDQDLVVVLGRGPSRAAAEMAALTLKESGTGAESFATGAFRHGPLELAGPDLAAIVLATEPETRELDLGLAAELVRAGASVSVLAAHAANVAGALTARLGYEDRLLGSAVAIVPVQLLAHRLAVGLGRAPGAYLRATKVTTRE